jgi:hypothetical protein
LPRPRRLCFCRKAGLPVGEGAAIVAGPWRLPLSREALPPKRPSTGRNHRPSA